MTTISQPKHNPDLERLPKLLEALEPWLPQVVIVGGWAHRLFRYHPFAQSVQHEPLLTLDTDVAIPTVLEVRGQDLRQRLLGAGFKEQFLGKDQPPATTFHHRSRCNRQQSRSWGAVLP